MSWFSPIKRIPRAVWTLGFVSLCMDMSSELIHSILPLWVVSTLGASMVAVGFIEGIAEATASFVKLFAGALSDYMGKRKLIAVIGYAFGACAKPLFPLSTSVMDVFWARFLDRVGKGIRGAPRDALMAHIAPSDIRGLCFGLRHSLDSIGAVLGPLLAIVALMVWSGNVQIALWIGSIPAIAAVLILALGVEEPSMPPRSHSFRIPIVPSEWKILGRRYWHLVWIAGGITLARYSDAFLILRAHSLGLSDTWGPITMMVMSGFFALSAFPIGHLSDRLNRYMLLTLGLVVLVCSNGVLACATTGGMVFVGAALWGLHLGMTQGIFNTLIAEAAPKELHGTAFGMYHLTSSIALLGASSMAGMIWHYVGPEATFWSSALLTSFGVLALGTHRCWGDQCQIETASSR